MFSEVEANFASIGEVEGIGFSGFGGEKCFVFFATREKVVGGIEFPKGNGGFELACGA